MRRPRFGMSSSKTLNIAPIYWQPRTRRHVDGFVKLERATLELRVKPVLSGIIQER